MTFCLILAAYIAAVGIFYYKDRYRMAMLELYKRDNIPIGEGMLRLSFVLMAAALPFAQLYKAYQRRRMFFRLRCLRAATSWMNLMLPCVHI